MQLNRIYRWMMQKRKKEKLYTIVDIFDECNAFLHHQQMLRAAVQSILVLISLAIRNSNEERVS